MRKLIVTLALVALAAPAFAQQRMGWGIYNYDWTATSYTYCALWGEQSPFSRGFQGPSKIKTSGSSTTVTEAVTDSLPFTNLAVGDVILVRRGTVTDIVSITAKASGASITVSAAVNWEAEYNFEWLDLRCGTAATDGWFPVTDFEVVDAVAYWATKNATSLDFTTECRVNEGPAVTITTTNMTAIGTSRTNLTAGVFDHCRIGFKLNTDTGAQVLTSYLAFKK